MKKIILTILLLGICLPCYGADISKLSNKEVYKTTLGIDEVIIGDDKSSTFKPQVTFTKWDKEETLSIISDKVFIGNASSNNKVYSIDGNKEKFYFKINPDNDSEFKFGLILKEKPATNKFTYQLQGWENFNFYYQYEEPTDWTIHPDRIISQNDNSVTMRAFNNEITVYKKYWKGYAIYHKTKRNHEAGKTNYMCGKFGDLIRPKFIDAEGKFEIADLNIKDGIYTVTISQDFLDNAKYPILVNDTFGNTTQPTGNSSTLNQTWAAKYQLTGAGTVTSITMYCGNGSSFYSNTGKAYAGIYEDSSNYPGDLITYYTPGIVLHGQDPFGYYDWFNFDIDDQALSAGYYWLAPFGEAIETNVGIFYDSGGTAPYYTASKYPDPYTGGASTQSDRLFGIYATYTAKIVALTGTITSATTEANIVSGGKTIVLTLTGDTWVATVGEDNAITDALIAGIDSAQSEANGWDAVVKANMVYTDVVRTSDTVVTITLGAEATYNIIATETITATVPASALTGAVQMVATPTFTISATPAGNIKVLVVGGGGAGGGRHGGGGGGGGVVYNASYSVIDTAYAIVVGAGGATTQNAPDEQSVGGNGANSTFGTITALGGGGGGSYSAAVPTGGGSGGGGGGGSGGYPTHGLANQGNSGGGTGYGYNGGDGSSATGTCTGGGGGGGAGAVGSNAAGADSGGNGGAGYSTTIYDGSTDYFAGGGGGGGNTAAGTGGSGGGGDGGSGGAAGSAGTANTGGGGGGSRSDPTTNKGGIGGSGIVIIRYVTADFGTCTVSGVGNAITTDGADSIATFIVNGNFTVVAAAAAGVIKTINGLAIGSVKTINGLEIESVKTYNGAAAQ